MLPSIGLERLDGLRSGIAYVLKDRVSTMTTVDQKFRYLHNIMV